ncbi:MAG: hypothetical protein IKI93_10560, partial [Clostridia bacterium]|nr:hypothetical protein [Clostridia bacterium]
VCVKKDILCFLEEKGALATLHDYRVSQFLNENCEKWLNDLDTVEATVRQVCEDFRDFPALYCYHIFDEPTEDKIPLLAEIVKMFKKHDPKHFCYINQWPMAAMNENWLQRYMDEVSPDLLSYDQYHLCTDNRPEEDLTITDAETAIKYAAKLNRIDNEGYYKALERARLHALRKNIPYMLIILLTEHGKYRYLLPEEIRYEVYQTLAYGCSALSYFRYWASEERPPVWRDQNSCVTGDGDNIFRCQHYYDVPAINREIRPIGEHIAATVSEAVFHVGEESDPVQFFTEYKDIRSITGGRYTVGFFEDGSFLIANKDYMNSSICTVETDTELEVFDTKKSVFVPVSEKQFTIPAGGGVYLRRR